MSQPRQTPQPHVITKEDIERIRANFPTEMIALPQWVPYSLRWNEKTSKFDKIPMNPNTGYNAKSNKPETWGRFEIAVKRALNRGLGGVGFVFSENDPYVGIDLDIDPCAGGGIPSFTSLTLVLRFNRSLKISLQFYFALLSFRKSIPFWLISQTPSAESLESKPDLIIEVCSLSRDICQRGVFG